MRYVLSVLLLVSILPSVLRCQGSILLVGGGSENYNDWSDVPYRWLVAHAPNRKVIVLHYSDTTAFFSGYFPWVSPCTVSNLAITSSAQANDSAVYRRILQHDGIFLRGGDQWQYVNRWRGTLAAKAIREVYDRGGVVGGTSAGEAILSEVVYDAQLNSVTPRNALRNPLESNITLTDDFLKLGTNLLADSHFYERGRLGRLPTFLALYERWKGRGAMGVGVDYSTALAIGPNGDGEVMGAGTVTLLRYAQDTRTLLETGKALSMAGVLFDQLSVGSIVRFSAGEVVPPPAAIQYSAKQESSSKGTVILDGSSSSADWSSATGSLRMLQSALLKPTDSVGIIASPASPGSANSVHAALTSWGVASRVLWIGADTKDDPIVAAAISRCGGFVFAGNAPDSLAALLDTISSAGRSFSRRPIAPIAFLGDDVILAGEYGISQMYRSVYGAYYGYLNQVRGLGVVKGVQIVPRLFEQADYIDNRASSVCWSMATSQLPFGLMVDAGTHVLIAGNSLSVRGSTPVLLIDARSARWASFPSWRDPGKTNSRQNGGIIGARLNVLRDGEVFDLNPSTRVGEEAGARARPVNFELSQNYPNPFNESTIIRYQLLMDGYVILKVYDLLGREVAVVVNEKKAAGGYEVRFDAGQGAGLPSGVYVYRLIAGQHVETCRMVLMK